MAEILVIDDEESIRYTFASFLSEEGHGVLTAQSFAEGIAQICARDFDLIFSDIILGGRTGVDILREVRERNLVCPVVMVTGYPTLETAGEAVRLGAFDYLPKPVEQETLLHVTRLALEHEKVLDENETHRARLEAIFGSVEDGIMSVDQELAVLEMNEAAENMCGLTRDEIGRELISSSIHCKEKFFEALTETVERRRSVKLDRFECRHGTSAPRILTLSTSPLIDRQGMFRGAVLVVRDETHLASFEQNLQERRRFHNLFGKSEPMQKVYSLIERLADVETTILITGESGTGKELVAEALHYMGGRSHLRVDVRVIAATNQNLQEKVKSGDLREDLYYRLEVVELSLPPLRDRGEDIPLLVDHFLELFRAKFRKEILTLSADVEQIFQSYSWPGNVRELKHALEHAFLLCRQDTITVDDLPLNLQAPQEAALPSPRPREGVDAQAIRQALEKTAWNKAKAARLLGIDRKTLYRNLEKYRIA